MPDPETIDADQAAQADHTPPQPAPEAIDPAGRSAPDSPLAASACRMGPLSLEAISGSMRSDRSG